MAHCAMLLLWIACADPEPADADCERLCDELVDRCDLQSFPDRSSCADGCAYARRRGVDVAAQADCTEAAQCDLFAIVACEHDASP